MKIPLRVLLVLLCAVSGSWAQPFGLTNRVQNTTLRMPLVPTPIINYRIPPDNPFIGRTTFNGLPIDTNNLRTEFYAVGLRNPWRFSFDRVTGLLWLGDVGQGAREEVDVIYKGGNYGWNYREGFIARPGSPAPPPGFSASDPVQDYPRGEGFSITGGFVYRGSRMPELYGAYIFADYGSGRIWQMRYEVTNGLTNITPRSAIATNLTGQLGGISCFGPDPFNGDVLLGDLNTNRIRRIVPVGQGYGVANAFPDALTFNDPVVIVSPPGETNRLFIVEQAGRIAVITNLANPNRTVFLDIASRIVAGGEQGLLGLAFHPGYATNGQFYTFYTVIATTTQAANTLHDRLSKWRVSASDPNLADTTSEVILFQQWDQAGNHNGGDLHFGPEDGYLYISLGDEGDANDSRMNSQRIDKDFFSGVMRIDVDNRPESLMPIPHPANSVNGSVMLPPLTLEDTGIFSNVVTRAPNPGVIPFDVNVPYWTDGAIKSRWFCIPDVASRITFRSTQTWTFPIGTVWAQHFDLEMTNGVPESRRPIETRVLTVFSSTAQGHYGASYRWDSPTNATLVPEEGAEETFEISDNGTTRLQTWTYPSRADCVECHSSLTTQSGGRALGFNTPQLNRDFDYWGVVDNQIRSLMNAGYFLTASAPTQTLHTLPRLARLDDTSVGVQHRARSYLMANCAHCHFPGGTGDGNFNARIYQVLSTQGLINGSLRDNLGDPLNRVLSPGSLEHSVAYQRLASDVGGFGMPPKDRRLVDQQAVSILGDWIFELENYLTFAQWQTNHFGGPNAPNAGTLADFDGDGARNQLEYFTRTDPTDPSDFWTIDIQRAAGAVSIVYTQAPNSGFEVQWTTNTTNLSASWRALNIPANRPSFPGQEQVRTVTDVVEPVRMKAYRVRVYEP